MTRRLDLCADDFGLTPQLSQVVAALAGRGRVSSLSCLVNTPHWAACAPLLAPLAGRVGLGLHFNLTEGAPRSAALARRWPHLPALPRLIAGAHLRRLPLTEIAAEWQAQLEAFVQATGRPPDHVDGHQHVHHLPGVRDIVLAGVAALAPVPGVRNTGRVLGPGFALKRRLIEGTGGRALARLLARRGLPHSAALLGAYDFAAADYAALLRGWLRSVPAEGALLFCHPGPAAADDAIGAARQREFDYFSGEQFPRDLAAADVALGRAWRR
jgi:hypothetical protein